MRITVIHGSNRKGSTYHVAKQFVTNFAAPADEVTEFFLPKDMSAFCTGCANCFSKGEEFCPHFQQVEPIRLAIEAAEVVVFTTPVYVLRTSGQMKALLDHFAFLYMTHRPSPKMFSKIAVIFSTGAGGGTKAAMKDIGTSLRFWGMAKIFKMGAAVFATEWSGVSEKKKHDIAQRVKRLVEKVRKKTGKVHPDIHTKVLFFAFRLMHKKMQVCEKDDRYWEGYGWLQRRRPWEK